MAGAVAAQAALYAPAAAVCTILGKALAAPEITLGSDVAVYSLHGSWQYVGQDLPHLLTTRGHRLM